MSKSTIAYRIEIDHAADTVAVKEQGRKGFLMKVYAVTAGTVATACRNAAYQMLERAHFIEHQNDFLMADFNLSEQVAKMEQENKSIFEF